MLGLMLIVALRKVLLAIKIKAIISAYIRSENMDRDNSNKKQNSVTLVREFLEKKVHNLRLPFPGKLDYLPLW